MERFIKRHLNEAQQLLAYKLSDKYGIDSNICEHLVARNINLSNADAFFSKEGLFIDPFLLVNMTAAVELIKKVAISNGKIIIYGDYDADGLSATSVLKLFFDNCGINCNCIIPNREEGYGLNVDKIIESYNSNKFDLLITVDCGISNFEEIELIKSKLNIEIIVTDHHELPKQLPDCICINPKMGDYPFKELSGSGVAWKLVWALSDLSTAKDYAFLASIGTIADVMPLVSENRALVITGLNNAHHISINYLAKQLKIKEITAGDIALKLAPRINSAGRIGRAELALEILLGASNLNKELVNQLIEANDIRHQYLNSTLKLAYEMLDNIDINKLNFICLFNKDFYKGVIGIAANRLADQYKKPVLLLSYDYDNINLLGSARSVNEIDIFEVFTQFRHLLIKYGGHKHSVGLTIGLNMLNEFILSVNNALTNKLKETTCILYDLEFSSDCSAQKYYTQLQLLQPNLPSEQPVFHYKGSCNFAALFGPDRNHIKFNIANNLEIKAFNDYSKYLPLIINNGEIEILFKIDYDEYSKNVVGVVDEFRLSHCVYYNQLYSENILLNGIIIDQTADVNKLIIPNESICIVFNSYEDYQLASICYNLEDFILDYFYLENTSDKQILISPCDVSQLANYKNIISFIDDKLHIGFKIDNSLYYPLNSKNGYLADIMISRDICALVYKTIIKQPCTLKRLHLLCSAFGITYLQTLLAVKIFQQLNIINYNMDVINADISNKVELQSSNLFKQLQVK